VRAPSVLLLRPRGAILPSGFAARGRSTLAGRPDLSPNALAVNAFRVAPEAFAPGFPS
jgi:hypothetical protein